MTRFQVNDPSLESQWRAIILFGKNSATYKFALAKSLLELIKAEKTSISLQELAEPFSRHIINHLRDNPKQGNSMTSTFLATCSSFIAGEVSEDELLGATEKLGFINVVDAFPVVNGITVPKPFYEKNYINTKKEIVLTDNLLSLKESFHFENLGYETEARWKLVETAWNLQINPNLLEVKYDDSQQAFFLETDFMRRKDITSIRGALNGYQKGKCFYSLQDISVEPKSNNLCHVDHFLPHVNKGLHLPANINGVWNLVLVDSRTNLVKKAMIPTIDYLEKLYRRNEYYVESRHPLAETIINQTGSTPNKRQRFLQMHYDIALKACIHIWNPKIVSSNFF